ncbi:hypothetical protein LPJ64_005527 [Coemansia asiatica]|uniref:Carbohydrate-binding module family 96 domain-containing protein n=1 Tax=Coemansia asiatica TaxID=1052880 RepID=A0A9W7XFY1_9FUNG|nr:hypothetical protein LPJ64_005527 [Coemansia asiatica]
MIALQPFFAIKHFIAPLLLVWIVLLLYATSAKALRSGNQELIAIVARDSTIVQSTNKTNRCYGQSTTPKGMLKTLVAESSADRKSRILLGFDMPKSIKSPSHITNCTLIVPVPNTSSPSSNNYILTAYAVAASDNRWNEKTVSCSTSLQVTEKLGFIKVKKNDVPGDIDVTHASC